MCVVYINFLIKPNFKKIIKIFFLEQKLHYFNNHRSKGLKDMQNYVFAELPEIKNTKQKNQGSKHF